MQFSPSTRLNKLTSAVRETSVSRHIIRSIEGPPETSHYHSALFVWGIVGLPWNGRATSIWGAPLVKHYDQLRGPLKPLLTIVLWLSEGFHGCPQLSPHNLERRSLSDSYAFDLCCFASLDFRTNRIAIFTVLEFSVWNWKVGSSTFLYTLLTRYGSDRLPRYPSGFG